jgi:hypothetical protein
MGLSQAQTVGAAGFIPGPEESRIVSRAEALRIAEPKQTNGFYEAMLLAFSFVFLLLGLLPSQPEQVSGAGQSSGEDHRKIET